MKKEKLVREWTKHIQHFISLLEQQERRQGLPEGTSYKKSKPQV